MRVAGRSAVQVQVQCSGVRAIEGDVVQWCR
jgi:hypothetical protein